MTSARCTVSNSRFRSGTGINVSHCFVALCFHGVEGFFGSSLRPSRVNLISPHVTFLTFKVFKVDQCIAVHSISISFLLSCMVEYFATAEACLLQIN